jgi:hypothetical protein
MIQIELTPEDEQLLRLGSSEPNKTAGELVLAAARRDAHRSHQFEKCREQLARKFQAHGISDDELAEDLERARHQG